MYRGMQYLLNAWLVKHILFDGGNTRSTSHSLHRITGLLLRGLLGFEVNQCVPKSAGFDRLHNFLGTTAGRGAWGGIRKSRR